MGVLAGWPDLTEALGGRDLFRERGGARGHRKGLPLSASDSGSNRGFSALERPGRVCTVRREDPGRVEKDGREASRESQGVLM